MNIVDIVDFERSIRMITVAFVNEFIMPSFVGAKGICQKFMLAYCH